MNSARSLDVRAHTLAGFATVTMPDYGWRNALMLGGLIPLLCLPFYFVPIPESVRSLVVKRLA